MNSLADRLYSPAFDLKGPHLIRASAGTGKTYSIQSLYLRLVLEYGLTVEQILVVTFTQAATKELRDRLRKVLERTAHYLQGVPAADPVEQQERTQRIEPLVALVDRETAQRAVQAALLDYDLAAIHTIHGFCQRALAHYAFESGQAFDVALEGGQHAAIDAVCEDWWRTNTYSADTGLLAGLVAMLGLLSLGGGVLMVRRSRA